jgi:hypothetical protein
MINTLTNTLSLIAGFGLLIYSGRRGLEVFIVICAICMCANGTIVTDIFVGSVYLAIVVYLVFLV